MFSKELVIKNSLGIHARPASLIVKALSNFKSNVTIEKDGIEVNAKSIMGILMLACEKGSKIIVKADGVDEKEAVLKVEEIVENKFYEE
uniref:HPr family phosphocarrier protein n=1 Tax=candidate division WOR-3 bacterium TaxID=2052148 RepID=A0A7C4YHK5_UNCW3